MLRKIFLISFWVMLFVESANAEITLKISDLSAVPDAITCFEAEYPDIHLEECDTLFDSQEKFVSFLLTEDSSIDIYAITVSMGLDALKSKHYLPVLKSSIIEQEVNTWYPAIQSCVSNDEGIIAVPYNLTTNEWGLNENLWNKLFPSSALTTWQEYLNLMLMWQQNDQLVDAYNLSYAGQTQDDVMCTLLFSYISYYETGNAPLDFNTSSFRECLALVYQLPVKNDEPEDEDQWNERLSMPTLLNETPENIGSSADLSHRFIAIPEPRFDKDSLPILRGDMQMFVINPYSIHREEAILFLETVLQSMPDNQRIRFTANVSVPIENPYWLKYHMDTLDELNSLLGKGQLSESEQDQVEKLQLRLMDESDRFLVTSQESERYQQLAQYLTFNDESDYFGFQNKKNIGVLLSYTSRYFSDNISLDKCIQELNRISKQVFYE